MNEILKKKVDYYAQLAKFSIGLQEEFAADKQWLVIGEDLMQIAYRMGLSTQTQIQETQGGKNDHN